MVRSKRDIILKKHSKTVIPVISKRLPDDRDFRFQARFSPGTAHLAVHGNFPEAILDANSMFVAYYNNSEANIYLPANTHLGELSEWQSDEKATPEDTHTIDCLFTTARIIPSLKFTMTTGLSALQATQALFSPGDTYQPSPTSLLASGLPTTYPSVVTSVYLLLPPLDESGENAAKFGAQAVNVNTTDDITKEQIDGLRNVLAEFPSLWEDRVGRVIEPEENWMQIPLKEGTVLDSKG
jgi:hypothetical protein